MNHMTLEPWTGSNPLAPVWPPKTNKKKVKWTFIDELQRPRKRFEVKSEIALHFIWPCYTVSKGVLDIKSYSYLFFWFLRNAYPTVQIWLYGEWSKTDFSPCIYLWCLFLLKIFPFLGYHFVSWKNYTNTWWGPILEKNWKIEKLTYRCLHTFYSQL